MPKESGNDDDNDVKVPTKEEIAELEKAFNSGFEEEGGTATAAPKALESPEPTPAPTATPGPTPDTTPEPTPEPDRQELLEQRLNKWMRDMGGRIGANEAVLRRIEDQGRVTKPAAESPTKAQIAAAMKDGDKFKELTSDFPLWGEAMDEVLGKIEQRLQGIPGAENLEELKTQLASSREDSEATAMSLREVVRVDGAFPGKDWEGDINTLPFNMWYSSQSPEIQELANSSKSADAIRLISSFYDNQASASKQQNRRDRVDAAVDPITGGGKPNRSQGKSVDDAFNEGFTQG